MSATTIRSDIFTKDVTVLVIGVEGIGKGLLAKELIKLSSLHEIPPINMTVQFIKKITPEFELLDIDLAIALMDLTRKNSLTILEDLKLMNIDLLIGKLCFVVLGSKHYYDRAINICDIITEITEFHAPIFYGGSSEKSEFEILANKLMQFVLTTCGLKFGISSPFLLNWNCAHLKNLDERPDNVSDT